MQIGVGADESGGIWIWCIWVWVQMDLGQIKIGADVLCAIVEGAFQVGSNKCREVMV